MALPQPGNPISANMINVEASRAGTTANTKLAGASTPAAGSLVKIYAVASPPVNQVAPHITIMVLAVYRQQEINARLTQQEIQFYWQVIIT